MGTKTPKQWIDETGKEIPAKYITATDKLKEKRAELLLKQAKAINILLMGFKVKITAICDEIYDRIMSDLAATGKTAKGNFTWYNFDRSIKIEVSVCDRIDFDDLTIKAAKAAFDEYMSENITSKDGFGGELIEEAFSTSNGKLDRKKVFTLFKWRQKIQHAKYQEGCNLLEKAIRRPDSKMYFRVSERQKDGKYKAIDLNFSSL